ncbi:MaoC dehydratase-like protein [Branchiibius hedensis]|uniref:N-terminal half of MaoC dehydratase n=1 Tax=Branchiibius hedensis TaxID=672460 RepID=A0A2Y9A007_9MICO|nr:MaoC family dehydratase N-terminal domain-containing protein [Branchiibius hedensis]PWJ27038.1 MaoC dehydratase-like protein [Branchiibius hedensis]SSA35849.1 N-terminal half of MaoC dehydratase [Branchiibius hedensis]
MANPDAVGAVGEPFRIDIELGKIREFARATMSTNPQFWAQEAPVTPPTFLTTTMHWQPVEGGVWGDVELDQQRGMHAEQEFVFHGPPPRAGARLTAQSEITDYYTKPGRRGGELTFVVMRTRFTDQSGTLVAESIMTGVETSAVVSEEDPR